MTCDVIRNQIAHGGKHAMRSRIWFAGSLVVVLLIMMPAAALPPDYQSFRREQSASYEPDVDKLLRIWVTNVGQGDGIVVQLPDEAAHNHGRVDVIIDGGPGKALAAFLKNLYFDEDPIVIEHLVLTHHDQDHIAGLIAILEDDRFHVEKVHHNGLVSYDPDAFADNDNSDFNVLDDDNRALGRWRSGLIQPTLVADDLLDSLEDIRSAHTEGRLTSVWERFAEALIEHAQRNQTLQVNRVVRGDSILESSVDANGINIDVLWPPMDAPLFGVDSDDPTPTWSKTTNGNSVTLRLEYGSFEMLFTGDHNKPSQNAMRNLLESEDAMHELVCDVLKVPHHCSDDSDPDFIRRAIDSPVVSVASMGSLGFRSKAYQTPAWQHPSEAVISALGGAHRVYHTYSHEKRFRWSDITDDTERSKLVEETHILIESDGVMFRLVEVDPAIGTLNHPPSIADVQRGNGTRWVNALPREGES